MDRALAALSSSTGELTVGLTWAPPEVLSAMFWGRARTPAEALSGLASELQLDFAFVPLAEAWAPDACAMLSEHDVAPICAIDGVLGRVAARRGWARTLADTAADPGSVASDLAVALHESLDQVRAAVRHGAAALVLADDLAAANGPLVSPDYALDALVPCYASIARTAQAMGLQIAFHSDGDLRSMVPALARAGFCAIHPGGADPEALAAHLETASREGMAVIGGLTARDLLPGAKRAAQRAQALWRSEPRLVLADDGGIASAEELAAFVSAVRVLER